MGIYDRDYVRRDGPSFLGSLSEHGAVCKWLIILTVGIFVIQLFTDPPGGGPGWVTEGLQLQAEPVLHGQVWRLLTYAFVHHTGTLWTILFNMLFLWWFGRDLEDLYGSREFLTFYLASILLGGLAFLFTSLASGMPQMPVPYLGAAPPVAAVLVLCAVHYPRRIIYLFFFLPVPIWLLAIFEVASDAFVYIGSGARGMAAAYASVFAFIYGKRHWRLSDWWPDVGSWRRRLARPRLRVYREEEPARVPAVSLDDDHLESRIDAILEKISRIGKENLTEEERQLLLRASEVFRRRRS
jgi:membrane associated rhomboid family serine protease